MFFSSLLSSVRDRLLGPLGLTLFLFLGASGCGQELAAFSEGDGEGEAAQVVGRFFAQGIPSGYYDSAVGKSGVTLFAALAERVYKGHVALSYNGARNQLFDKVEDWDNDDKVDCLYTGRWGNPVNSTATAKNVDMNTEHTWPQSLGATGIAQADLHHLFASDMDVNGRRGNYPFGEVKSTVWTALNSDETAGSQLGTNDEGETVFEPHDHTKGDIARAIFYFYTRYSTRRPAKWSTVNFKLEETVLRKWHQMDPPDAEERAKNDLIYALQGNRNPYIDHPEYVAAIPAFP